MSNPYLRDYWVDHEDCGAFNGLARTLMRFGIVELLIMNASIERYTGEELYDSGYSDDWEAEEELHFVDVEVKVDGEYEKYTIVEDY